MVPMAAGVVLNLPVHRPTALICIGRLMVPSTTQLTPSMDELTVKSLPSRFRRSQTGIWAV